MHTKLQIILSKNKKKIKKNGFSRLQAFLIVKVVRKYQDEDLRSSFYAKSIGRFKNDFLKKLPCTTTKRTIGRLLIFERCFATQYD